MTFRVRSKIFAMGGDGADHASIKSTPMVQADLIDRDPETFKPAAYVGRFGWVNVDLGRVDEAELKGLDPAGMAPDRAEATRGDDGGTGMTSMDRGLPEHVRRNRAAWDAWAPEYVERGARAGPGVQARRRGASGGIPESERPSAADDVEGLDTIELGCGTGYVSAWLARRGARPVGIDNSPSSSSRRRGGSRRSTASSSR